MSQEFLIEEAIGSAGSNTRLPEELRQEWRERVTASDGLATLTDEEIKWLQAEYNWLPPKHPDRLDARIQNVAAKAYVNGGIPNLAEAFTVLNPAQPQKDPDELLKEFKGNMRDPRAIDHNCPFCDKTMRWELFLAHLRPCIEKYAHMHVHSYAVGGLE